MPDTRSVHAIADLRPGDHLCCLYETEEEHRAVLTPFLRQGLERGQKVVYIVDARTAEAILNYLQDNGLDVKPYLASGQLTILTHDDAYMREGVFDPDGMITLLRAETERALAEGYPALRVTGEMTWALRGLPGSERLIEYEAKLNEFFPGSKCLAICQYDRRRFDPEVLLDVLRTHPIAVIGTEIYDNLYYMPPTELLGGDLPSVELRRWVQNLAERKRAERLLQALNEAALAMRKALTPEEIFTAVAEELKKLGFVCAVFLPDESQNRLFPKYLSHDAKMIKAAEKLTGLKAEDFSIPVEAVDVYRKVIWERKTVFAEDAKQVVRQVLPKPTKRLVGQLVRMLKVPKSIAAPLIVEDEVIGLFSVLSDDLTEDDMPAITAFAHQMAAAWHKARLLQFLQRSLEERIEAEEALRESEERLRTVVSNVPVVLFSLDRQGVFTLSEGKGLDTLGLKPGEAVGRSVFEMYRDVPQILENIRRALAGETFTSIVEVGELVFETEYSPLRDQNGEVVGVLGIAADITERQQAEEELRQRELRLSVLNRMGRALAETFDLTRIYRIAYEHVAQLVDCPSFGISLYDPTTLTLRAEFMLDDGELIDAALFPPLDMDVEPTQGRVRAIATRQPEIITDYPAVAEKATDAVRIGVHEDEGFTGAAMYVPMVARDQVIGLLEVQSYRLNAYGLEEAALLGPVANQIGLAIQNARLYEEVQQRLAERKLAEEELRRSHAQLQKALEGTINVLVSAIEIKDPYTAGHQRRVTQLACAIASEMGLAEERIEGLRMAGLIHDIGKINIPAEILSKPGQLNDLEWGMIEAHPQIAYDILKTIDFSWPVAEIVFQHHERMDGSGYPQGLSGENIMPEARILAVADVVEAMASHRPYRPARGLDKALEEISQNRGVLYDPEVVDTCLKLFTEKGFEFE